MQGRNMVYNRSNADLLMVSLAKFFSHSEHLGLLGRIIRGSHRLSLRVIDWFVTNYSRTQNVLLSTSEDGPPLNVHLAYRSQLKAYSKQLFDPFRRRDRISFVGMDGTTIETTVGQLNFFRWAISHNIIDYIEKHVVAIENDMTSGGSETITTLVATCSNDSEVPCDPTLCTPDSAIDNTPDSCMQGCAETVSVQSMSPLLSQTFCRHTLRFD
jgi:hypothetical protein